MSPRKYTPFEIWQRELVSAFHDYRWQQVLDPLYEQFQLWKAGEISHDELNEALNKSYRDRRDLYNLFYEKISLLARMIELNTDFYEEWVKEHPKPEED